MGVSKTCQVWPRSGEWKTRAALPPVANQMLLSDGAEGASFSGCAGAEVPLFRGTTGLSVDGRIAIQELLAAKAPSPSDAGGSCFGGMCVHVWPSSVIRSSNFKAPVSSTMGSPRTMPWVRSQKTMESKKPLGFVLVYCRFQFLPAFMVW